MSFKKYRFIDLFIFLVIYLTAEYCIETAATVWFPDQIFSVSLLLPISILVMVRWEWFSIVNVVIYALSFVLFTSRPGTFNQYMIYLFGAIGLCLSIFALTKKKSEKITSKWYLTVFYVVLSYLVMNLFRGIAAMIFNKAGIEAIWQFVWTDSLNLAFGLVVILITRKINGLLMNQKTYLFKLEKEKNQNVNEEEIENVDL